jgi:hypothetical protein
MPLFLTAGSHPLAHNKDRYEVEHNVLSNHDDEFPHTPPERTTINMGAETVLLGPQAQTWGEFKVKANCTSRYSPITGEWPATMEGDLAWGAASFASEDDYTLTLTESEVSEVRSGLQHFNGGFLGLAATELCADEGRTRALRKRSNARHVPPPYPWTEAAASCP